MTCAKMAEPIEMLFWIWTIQWAQGRCIRWGADWHNLANTVELSMCGGDAACCQVSRLQRHVNKSDKKEKSS